MLNELVGALTFDPMEFANMPAKEQANVLRELVGLDVSDIEAEYKDVYAERRVLNRQRADMGNGGARRGRRIRASR